MFQQRAELLVAGYVHLKTYSYIEQLKKLILFLMWKTYSYINVKKGKKKSYLMDVSEKLNIEHNL